MWEGLFEFVEQSHMPDLIKSLTDVNESSSAEMFVFWCVVNFVYFLVCLLDGSM